MQYICGLGNSVITDYFPALTLYNQNRYTRRKEKKMTTERTKIRKHQLTSTAILDRIVDGKVIDDGEYYDRELISRQVGIILGMPNKQSPHRVR